MEKIIEFKIHPRGLKPEIIITRTVEFSDGERLAALVSLTQCMFYKTTYKKNFSTD